MCILDPLNEPGEGELASIQRIFELICQSEKLPSREKKKYAGNIHNSLKQELICFHLSYLLLGHIVVMGWLNSGKKSLKEGRM